MLKKTRALCEKKSELYDTPRLLEKLTRLEVPTSTNGHDSRAESPSLRKMPPPTPAPRYRHAAPSGPWPWMDFSVDVADVPALSPIDGTWKGYPQSIFPNWTPDQVERSEMVTRCSKLGDCIIYNVDVKNDGEFADPNHISVNDCDEDELWMLMQNRGADDIRVQALFVENMSLPVMQILGTRYNIEPFFFSSSMNWIPSHYQEDPDYEGDHITIILPFIRVATDPEPSPAILNVIDTQRPLRLSSTGKMLVNDLLAVHMVRRRDSSTIISYHPDANLGGTSARQLHSIVHRAGRSIYWGKIFSASKDPTFFLLAILWYALYAWDEAFEKLYEQLTWLEEKVLKSPNDATHYTNELHVLQAHLLHHVSLLEEFHNSVQFVHDTANPALTSLYNPDRFKDSNRLLAKECRNLLSETEKLQRRRDTQSHRLSNVMNLAFATVNIEDSKQMRKLTEAAVADSTEMKILTGTAVRDSAAMKQVAYLTMLFLPASFTAGVFGMSMNMMQSESMGRFLITAITLTLITAWLIVALQSDSPFHDHGERHQPFWTRRLWWPLIYLRRMLNKWDAKEEAKRRGRQRRFSSARLPPPR